MIKGVIFDIKKYSIHDGPGIRTTIFFKGCPLTCWWCHNPESQDPKPEIIIHPNRCILCESCVQSCTQNAISLKQDNEGSFLITTDRDLCIRCGTCTEVCYAEAREVIGKEVTITEVIKEIEKDRLFYDQSGGGVTFSGGEPLFQSGFLTALLQECRDREIHTTLDTCGFSSWETIDKLRQNVNLFLYDLKMIDDIKHRRYVGVSNRLILDNLQRLSEHEHNIIIRIPIIPGINDDEENIELTIEFISSLPHLSGINLLPYHHMASSKYAGIGKEYVMPAFEIKNLEINNLRVLDRFQYNLKSFGSKVPVSLG